MLPRLFWFVPDSRISFLMPRPSFMTNVTRSSVVTFVNGSSDTATRSARLPGSMVPICCCRPSASAATAVTASRAKRNVANELSSNALRADARQTSLCAYLSVIALAGVLLNAVAGLWWADPVAALCMVPIIVKEGIEGLGEEADQCC